MQSLYLVLQDKGNIRYFTFWSTLNGNLILESLIYIDLFCYMTEVSDNLFQHEKQR